MIRERRRRVSEISAQRRGERIIHGEIHCFKTVKSPKPQSQQLYNISQKSARNSSGNKSLQALFSNFLAIVTE